MGSSQAPDAERAVIATGSTSVRQTTPETGSVPRSAGLLYFDGKPFTPRISWRRWARMSTRSNSPAAPSHLCRDKPFEIIDLCHAHDVLVSTGGIEHVLTQGPEAVAGYIDECRSIGFDIVEVSCGVHHHSRRRLAALIERTKGRSSKAKPEVGIQFSASGRPRAVQAEASSRSSRALTQARQFLEAGASMIRSEDHRNPYSGGRRRRPCGRLGLERVCSTESAPGTSKLRPGEDFPGIV